MANRRSRWERVAVSKRSWWESEPNVGAAAKKLARRGSGVKHAPTGRKPNLIKAFCARLFVQPRHKAAMFVIPSASF